MIVISKGINNQTRADAIQLLTSHKLPTSDLPPSLDDFFIAREGDQLVGIIGLEKYDENGLLRSMVVHPDYRNRNIASQLVQKIEEMAKAESLNAVYLLTETAEKYFEKKGYEKVERADVSDGIKSSSEFNNLCPVSAAVMRKKI
jgi:amino-acid N-acetyltransferase